MSNNNNREFPAYWEHTRNLVLIVVGAITISSTFLFSYGSYVTLQHRVTSMEVRLEIMERETKATRESLIRIEEQLKLIDRKLQ